ncbi:Co2+/Mg2+ efflux protein ApaG [Rubricoccus marinus]|uniref:Co2+/Mg2+ efflux protein ApaG n=1 Tax=Rubricoccus marinus TaxID=716817 RepID=A0A259U326_9BACT|nr:Co2+/Mg2+ efflux protein ApaG [Rubricoccus marinus]OZC04409.1 Co2+/Mg2+ efflux protein ApaG [Rubricoccus marinus]
MVSYEATTEAVTVTVRPAYLDGKSQPLARRFVFGYEVQIANAGAQEVQLLRRRWQIRDADGGVQEVQGEGVVGQQPVLAPGEAHTYRSFCVLPTFGGSMEGDYLMQRADGARFRAEIPRFFLRAMAN